MYDTQTPYLAAYVILRRDNKIAFVLRQNTYWMNGFYGLPSGKVEKGEAGLAGAIREAREEIGVEITAKDLKPVLTQHRSSTTGMEWIDLYFEAVTWQGEPINAEPHMHSELAWLDIHNLPENVIPSVITAMQAINHGDSYAEIGWESPIE